MGQFTYTPVPGSTRKALPGARAIGRTDPGQALKVTIKLRRKKALPDLKARPKQPLTRQQLATAYGGATSDANKVTSVLGKFGLKKVSTDLATRTIHLTGTVGQVEKAFDVKLFDYQHPDGNYRGRVGDVHVPKELGGIVQGVFGMDNRRMVWRRRQPVSPSNRAKALNQASSSWYIPSELAKHYNFPSGNGAGQAVGLLEFGGGYFPSDLSAFCQLAGVSMPTVKPISADGTSTSARDGDEGEVMLDTEIVAGVCPNATIVVYFANFTEQGWVTILDTATQDSTNNPGVLSVSWGLPEGLEVWTQQAMTQVNESLKEAAYLGITVCVASGDDGSSGADLDGNAHVNFPTSSPYALSVGGTTIPSKSASAKDVVWFEGTGLRQTGGGSTGGGVSAVFARPSWQSAITIQSVNSGAIAGRVVPDIAANADWNKSPYLLVVDGQSQGNGGTSAATPLWASLLTLINAQRGSAGRVGYVAPVLYSSSSGGSGATVGSRGCTDVTSGQNDTDKIGGYSAAVGYDAVSGWGVPNGQQLLAALSGASTGGGSSTGKKPKPKPKPKKKKP